MTPRPATLKEVAERSASLEEFGRNFRDWLHELRRHSSRPRLESTVREEPPLLAGRFAQGSVADAWLAAYADYLSAKLGRAAPEWSGHPSRISPEPWFADGASSPHLRVLALRDSPSAFKRRNLFTPAVDLPIALGAGRPAKSDVEKRKNNAGRQRRFRARQHAQLKLLKRTLARARPS